MRFLLPVLFLRGFEILLDTYLVWVDLFNGEALDLLSRLVIPDHTLYSFFLHERFPTDCCFARKCTY